MQADPAPAACAINPMVPLELSEAIAKALKRNPDHRYQSARELDAALAALSGTSSTTRIGGDSAPSTTRVFPVGSRRRAWTIGTALAAPLMAGVVARRALMDRRGLAR